ncbi:DUF5518 domain-containing protein [Halosimplex amylolyticum]|uniref:DUF5518 domain-containing protein n=1 Tax=Halosimplex amylolyticum TaxID=3396616 RepID=UPI003F55FBD0
MATFSRSTVRNGALGAVVGTALGFVPLVLLVAPFVGGGVAGYLERDGARRGAMAGAIAGVLMAALSAVVTGIVVFVRFGDLPFASLDAPLATLAVAGVLSLAAAVGQTLVAAVGGGLGGILEADRGRRGRAATAVPNGGFDRPWLVVLGSLVAGVVVFLAVAVVLTVVLDPLVWPSLLVSLPIGIVAGAAVAVLVHHLARQGRRGRVNWRTVGLGAVAVLVVSGLAVGGLALLGQQRIAESEDSTYTYEVTVDADESLESPTFYVPVPTENGTSEVGDQFVADVNYYRDAPTGGPGGAEPEPVNFTYELVDTEHGQLLAISADRIEVTESYFRVVENETMGWTEPVSPEEYDPDDPSMGARDDGSFTFEVTLVADERIDTADPFGGEPLLSPQYDRTAVDCPDRYFETQRCYEYESRVYAEYDTAENASVFLSAQLTGRNEWFSGGWTGNEYRERTSVELLGPQSGWHRTRAELEVGSGNYRR